MSNTPVLDLLADEARWCKGENKKESYIGCAYCILGAIGRSYTHLDETNKATIRVRQVLQKRHPEFNGLVSIFNDSPSTTHAMVVAVLMEAQV